MVIFLKKTFGNNQILINFFDYCSPLDKICNKTLYKTVNSTNIH